MRNLRPDRRGYALIELLVVITVTTVMLGLSAGMIHLLLKLDRAGRASGELAADLNRLEHDFRLDAHRAAPVEPTARPADRLTLTIDGGRTVEYSVRPADIVRTVREGDKVRHYDLYRRPSKATVGFEITREGSVPFASLVIDRPLDGRDDSLYRDLRIEAELGKDQRLNSRAE